jgi:pyruvate/2-oxoacid:ferredoxin oxidoreductase beta subunit
MVGPNFRVGKKIGCGNFGELKLGELGPSTVLWVATRCSDLISGIWNATEDRTNAGI